MKKLLVLILSLAISAAVLFGGCNTGVSVLVGRDGKDGASVSIYDAYEAAKTVEGNENLTFDEFLRDYLSYNQDDTDLGIAINKSLMSAVSIVTRFTFTRQVLKPGYGGIYQKEVEYTGALGSGVIISLDKEAGNALVVTNCHVIYDASADSKISKEIGLYLYGQDIKGINYVVNTDYSTSYDENYRIEATVIGASVDYDIALLKVENSEVLRRSDAVAAEFAASEDVYVGQKVYAVGNAAGEGIAVSSGIVSKDSEYIEVAVSDEAQEYRVLRTDASVNHGNSGGGLFNAAGEIIGIVNAKDDSSDADGMGYALPSSMVRRLVKNLYDANASGGSAVTAGGKKARINVEVSIADCYSRLNADGIAEIYETVLISKVTGAPAYGKFEEGDVIDRITITGADGTVKESVDVKRRYYVNDLLFSVRQGDTITLGITRNGESYDIKMLYDSSSYFADFG